jgi:hypothetical protein
VIIKQQYQSLATVFPALRKQGKLAREQGRFTTRAGKVLDDRCGKRVATRNPNNWSTSSSGAASARY